MKQNSKIDDLSTDNKGVCLLLTHLDDSSRFVIIPIKKKKEGFVVYYRTIIPFTTSHCRPCANSESLMLPSCQ